MTTALKLSGEVTCVRTFGADKASAALNLFVNGEIIQIHISKEMAAHFRLGQTVAIELRPEST